MIKDQIITTLAPEGVNVLHWLNGKATRNDVLSFLEIFQSEIDKLRVIMIQKLNEINAELEPKLKEIVKEAVNSQDPSGKNRVDGLASLVKVLGYQVDTMMRVATEGNIVAKNRFMNEIQKTAAMANFIESLLPPRVPKEMTLKDKVDQVFKWNEREDVVKIDFDFLKLKTVFSNKEENPFNEEEVAKLCETFHIQQLTTRDNVEIKDKTDVGLESS